MNLINNYEQLGSKKIYVNLAIYGLIVVLAIYFLLLPTIADILSLREQIIDQKITLERNLNRERDIIKLVNKMNRIKPELAKLDQAFINSSREIEFINTLEGLAGENNITMNISLNETGEKANDIFEKINLTIQTQGSFENLLKFLADIEKMNYYININYFEFASNQGGARDFSPKNADEMILSNASVSMRLGAETYWKK